MDDKKNKNIQSIKYNGKTIKLPCDILYNDIEIVTQTNPYSNQSCELPKFARGVYCAIKNAEIDGNYKYYNGTRPASATSGGKILFNGGIKRLN